jgi:hypothetical protein
VTNGNVERKLVLVPPMSLLFYILNCSGIVMCLQYGYANGSFLKGFLNKYSGYKSAATSHFILMKTSKKCFRIVPLYLPLGRQQTRTQDKNNKCNLKKYV